MKTALTTAELATALKASVWNKNGQERIYLKVGYNTKKMTTKAYVYIFDGQIKYSAYVDCANQPASWCQQREYEAIESMMDMVAEALEEH